MKTTITIPDKLRRDITRLGGAIEAETGNTTDMNTIVNEALVNHITTPENAERIDRHRQAFHCGN